MESEPTPTPSPIPAVDASEASSELNNLLQIIASATMTLEEATPEKAEKCRAMLMQSVQRAEKLAARLAAQAGGTLERSMTPADVAARAKAAEKPKQLIMVVDDEAMGLTLMKHILSAAGFEVTTAQSGFECLEEFRKRPFAYALVLLDLTMPFMDGEETFTRLKDIRENVPVLICTGFIQQERLERLMSSGLAGFLRKPIAPDEIVNLVRRTLAELRYARDGVTPRGFQAAM